jgi:mannose-6-phosphate isomerase-like protein (cupin superfamily)
LSWHYHQIKDETFYILKGRIELLYGHQDERENANSIILQEGQSFHIPTLMRHQLKCHEDLGATVIEVSTPHYDEDSIRIIKGD